MGNRAVVTFNEAGENSVGVYLHWNGSRSSVEAFCRVARELGVRDSGDPAYGMARFAQIVGNFFGGTTCVGIGRLAALDCDNGDNGTYVVGHNWEIVERLHEPHREEERSEPGFSESVYRECFDVNAPLFEERT